MVFRYNAIWGRLKACCEDIVSQFLDACSQRLQSLGRGIAVSIGRCVMGGMVGPSTAC